MKKKRSGGGANWMDTYGDMVTLLLCFFVLLYSMSTISEENWKALVMSFNPKARQIMTEVPSGGDGPSADADSSGVMDTQDNPDGSEMKQEDIENMLEQLYETLNNYSAQEGLQDSIAVEIDRDAGKVYVTFSEATFFRPNDSELLTESYPILDHISAALDTAAKAIEEVRIEGHTARAEPGRANNVDKDRTLSSERATNVLIYVQKHCEELDWGRLVSVGMGEWHPVAKNDTAEGRQKNRRVEVIISGRNIMDALEDDDILSYNTQPST